MNESRTWLVSVLFLDIVGYSKVPVDQQMATKLHFTGIVSSEIGSLDGEECIQLDTGDGCAICYLGDPEKLYPIAVRLSAAFAGLGEADPVKYTVRLGLNLGPVKVVDGIGGERNCVGAGINDAQRVMDFATDNQLLVSKAYYDIVSNMSSHYVEELIPAGTRADKHDKLHEIYELGSKVVPVSRPRLSGGEGEFDCDDSVRRHLIDEFAKYVGRNDAEAAVSAKLGQAGSLAELCDLLAGMLGEDDRYHFGEFTVYYGYGSKR